MQPVIYLFFNGNCHEAMSHYADVLGGEIGMCLRNSDAPGPENRMPGGDDLVMHMDMRFGDTMVMASDATGDMYSTPQGFKVQLEASSLEEFERVFNSLSKDAMVVEMPPEETFWAERFAMFQDKYGTPWILNYTGSKMQPED